MLLEHQRAAWFSMRWIKINLLVSLSSLYYWGDNLKDFLCQVNSDLNLSFFLRCFRDEVREFTASSELFHGFSSMFPWLLTLWNAFVLQMIQIGLNSLSLCSETTQFISNKLVIQLNSSIPFLWRDSIQLNSILGNWIWIDLRVWIDLYRSAQGPF